MGVGSGEQGVPPWIFIYDTDKSRGDFILLLFGLIFSCENFLPMPLWYHPMNEKDRVAGFMFVS